MKISTSVDFNKIDNTTSLAPLIEKWRRTLVAPQDGMWEAITKNADHWEIKSENNLIGYASVDDENGVLQFYLLPQWLNVGPSIFNKFILDNQIKKALVGTNNPVFHSIAVQLQQSVQAHTYMFTDCIAVTNVGKDGNLRPVVPDDLEKIVDFCHVSMGAPKEWLNGYIGNLIESNQIYVFENANDIIGTCEVRPSASDSKFADIGMIVSPRHRRKGMGTFLLGEAKKIASEMNKHPICSCEKDNIGSLKSIHNNGFRSIHQMLLMNF